MLPGRASFAQTTFATPPPGPSPAAEALTSTQFHLAVLAERSRSRGARPALVQDGSVATYGALADGADAVAVALGQTPGCIPGSRVALLTAHLPTWAEVVMGCSLAGRVPVPLNWRLSGRELRAILDDAGAPLLVADAATAEHIEPALADWPGIVVHVGDAYRAWRDGTTQVGPARHRARDKISASDGEEVALQLYTSGTTGRPKGVLLTHANLECLLERGQHTIRVDEACRNLFTLPPFHIAGAGFALITLYAGALGVVPASTAVEDLLAAISNNRITNTGLVPSLVQDLIDHPKRSAYDLSSVRTVVYGAAPMPPSLLDRVLAELSWGFLHTYGLTETAGFVTALEPEEHDSSQPERLHSCGRAVPWAELRAADPLSGAPLAPGELGEIQIRSPAVMKGYWRNEAATAEALDDGWLRSGDVGRVDSDGYVFIVDRRNAMIITGGENVYPAEVESALLEHPGVRHAAVAGVPHERWGETVKAFVVPAPGTVLSAEEVVTFARDRLAHFKCPTVVDFMTELPLNATGKVDRAALQAR